MKVSKVEIIPIRPKNGLVGFASLELDDELFLSSIGVHKKLNGHGYRITYPTKCGGSSNSNLFHPISSDLSREIQEMISHKAINLFKN